jgi:hypothetical protein
MENGMDEIALIAAAAERSTARNELGRDRVSRRIRTVADYPCGTIPASFAPPNSTVPVSRLSGA